MIKLSGLSPCLLYSVYQFNSIVCRLLSVSYQNFKQQNAKQSLSSNMSNPKSIFSFGSRRAQILHTRLRLECSSLNFDLHRRSIVDSPLCSCGWVETVDHFLLHCPLLADIRLRFLSDMPCPPFLQNLLIGIENLSTDQNKVIFSQDYIIASKRFG